MVTKLNKKNPLIRSLYSTKFKPKIVKPKKGKDIFNGMLEEQKRF